MTLFHQGRSEKLAQISDNRLPHQKDDGFKVDIHMNLEKIPCDKYENHPGLLAVVSMNDSQNDKLYFISVDNLILIFEKGLYTSTSTILLSGLPVRPNFHQRVLNGL